MRWLWTAIPPDIALIIASVRSHSHGLLATLTLSDGLANPSGFALCCVLVKSLCDEYVGLSLIFSPQILFNLKAQRSAKRSETVTRWTFSRVHLAIGSMTAWITDLPL